MLLVLYRIKNGVVVVGPSLLLEIWKDNISSGILMVKVSLLNFLSKNLFPVLNQTMDAVEG